MYATQEVVNLFLLLQSDQIGPKGPIFGAFWSPKVLFENNLALRKM